MATTVPEIDPAAKRSAARLAILEALCLRSETPRSLRVFCPSQGTNQAFRGANAPSRAAALALELQNDRADDWHIQTGQGWTVITAHSFQRMTAEEAAELLNS